MTSQYITSIGSALRRFFFPPLALRVIGVVAAVLIVAGGLFVFVAYRTGFGMLEDQAKDKAHGVSEVVAQVMTYAMLEGDAARLRSTFGALNLSHQVADILVLRNDGSVYLCLDSAHLGHPFSFAGFEPQQGYPLETFKTVRENGELFEYVISTLENRPECHRCHSSVDVTRGYVAAKISMDDIVATSSRHRTTNIVMVAIIFLGTGGVLVLALLVLVIRPVSRLREQMVAMTKRFDAVERGEAMQLPELPVPPNRDEITDLISSFNKLIGRLNEAYSHLHDLHQYQLAQADRLATTGEMAASIAHEIRNPVAGIMGALQVMIDESNHDDPSREILEEMKTQVERVNHAVTDLLAYARPAPPVFEDVLLQEIIRKTSIMVLKQTGDRQIQLKENLGNEPIVIKGDRKQLQQLLWNLMLNGIQAMGGTGTLEIRAEDLNGIVCVQITDSGKGIAPEMMEKIFNPFFSTKHKGTGLGMTICKRIVDQHHGTLTVTSKVNTGTTMTIRLPRRQGE